MWVVCERDLFVMLEVGEVNALEYWVIYETSLEAAVLLILLIHSFFFNSRQVVCALNLFYACSLCLGRSVIF